MSDTVMLMGRSSSSIARISTACMSARSLAVRAAGATIACPVKEKPGTALALAAFSEVALALESIDSARLGLITQPSMLMP